VRVPIWDPKVAYVSSGSMDILEFLASGMTGSGGAGDSAKACFSSLNFVDAISLLVVS
jgi:hypothetical protein